MSPQKQVKNVNIENARIGFRNFSGKEGRYNPAGRRNFCVFLDTPVAQELEQDGWNVKWLEPRDPDESKQAYLPVAVSYMNFPPRIVLITKKNQTLLDESTVNILDWAEIDGVDLIIRPYSWDVNGKQGIKAYVSKMYVTLVEDEFADKYKNVPDSAFSSLEEEIG